MAKRKRIREFDFKRYAKRRIALMVTYLGWDYDGLVVQDNTENTVEAALFKALEKVKLIESREMCLFERCGRTDKGVSAYQQVFSLEVRSNLAEGVGVFVPAGYRIPSNTPNSSKSDSSDEDEATVEETKEKKLAEKSTEEINYCLVLNRVLPVEIRALAWAPVDRNFSARFSCSGRIYKYFFPKGNLNVQDMESAAKDLIGCHDFRNFCRLDRDKSKAQNCVRCIKDVSIKNCDLSEKGEKNEYKICELTVAGSAFLWHQIRYTVSVLLAVGEGKESTGIVKELLNTEKVPRKPQYDMAADIPLCLFECCYENSGVLWKWDTEAVRSCVMKNLQRKWAEHAIKATMIRMMLEELSQKFGDPETQTDILYTTPRPRKYVPFLKRPTSDNVEDFEQKRAARGVNKKKKVAETNLSLFEEKV